MKKYIILMLYLIISLIGYGQTNVGGSPYSWMMNEPALRSTTDITTINMPGLDIDQLNAEDEIDEKQGKAFRFGYTHNVNLNLDNSGTWKNLSDGGRLWQLKIYSPDAKSINLTFDKFWLPEGAKMYIYSEDRKNILGAFTALNNNGTKKNLKGFATSLIFSNSIVVEYYEPKDITEGVISIDNVVSGYKYSFGEQMQRSLSRTTIEDFDLWDNEFNGMAWIWHAGGIYGVGILLNNTNGDNKPYCITILKDGKEIDPSQIIFTWKAGGYFFKRSDCETNGAKLLTSFKLEDGSDDLNKRMHFFELTESPVGLSQISGPYFTGWDCSGIAKKGGALLGIDSEFCALYLPSNKFVSSHFGGYYPDFGVGKYSENYWREDLMYPLVFHDSDPHYALYGPLFSNTHSLMGFYIKETLIEGVTSTTKSSRESPPFINNIPLYYKFSLLFNEPSGIVREKLDPQDKISSLSNVLPGTSVNKDLVISGQTITSSSVFSGLNIDISNMTVSNKATVLINAQGTIVMKPNTILSAGTTVIISAHPPKNSNQTKVLSTRNLEDINSINNNIYLQKAVSLYPNPTNGILNFRCSEVGLECSVNIYSMAGALIYSNDKLVDGNIIDLANQTRGIYIAKIQVGEEVKTEKIILQ